MAERSQCCDRVVVTPELLAEVSHTACAVGGVKHGFDACPNRQAAIVDARRRLERIDASVPRG